MPFTNTELAVRIFVPDKHLSTSLDLPSLALDILGEVILDACPNGWGGVAGYAVEIDHARRGRYYLVYGEWWGDSGVSEEV